VAETKLKSELLTTEPQDVITMKIRVTTAQDTDSNFTIDFKGVLRQGIIFWSVKCKYTKSKLITERMLFQCIMIYSLQYLSILFLPERKQTCVHYKEGSFRAAQKSNSCLF